MLTLAALRARGVDVAEHAGSLRVIGAASTIGPQLAAAVRASKPALLAELQREREGRAHAPTMVQARLLYGYEGRRDALARFVVGLVLSTDATLGPAIAARALERVAARHDAMRLRVRHGESGPRLALGAAPTLTIVETDAPHQAVVAALAEPVDPFERSIAVRWIEAERGTRIVLVANHLLFDGVSLGIVARELCETYRELAGGLPASARPALSFLEYAAWLRGEIERGALEDAASYWSDKLARTTPDVLFAPCAAPSIDVARSNAVGERRSADAATDFARELAALAIAIFVRSGQRDIAVLSPIGTRLHPASAHASGHYTNLAYLHVAIDGGSSLDAIVAQCAAEVARVLRHPLVSTRALRALPSARPGAKRVRLLIEDSGGRLEAGRVAVTVEPASEYEGESAAHELPDTLACTVLRTPGRPHRRRVQSAPSDRDLARDLAATWERVARAIATTPTRTVASLLDL